MRDDTLTRKLVLAASATALFFAAVTLTAGSTRSQEGHVLPATSQDLLLGLHADRDVANVSSDPRQVPRLVSLVGGMPGGTAPSIPPPLALGLWLVLIVSIALLAIRNSAPRAPPARVAL